MKKVIYWKKPRSIFQKKYSERFEYNGKEVWTFPGKNHHFIPSEISKSLGIEPTKEQLKTYKNIWKLTKSNLGYIAIDNFTDLTDYTEEMIYNNVVWLVKHQFGVANVDRYGRAAFFRFN